MIASLRDSKTKLSELVRLAESGEDVIITVRGQPKARLTAIKSPQLPDRKAWGSRLIHLQKRFSRRNDSAAAIVDEMREDRF